MKIPRIPTFSLQGIDDKVQTLQTVLGNNLSWLEYSFGRADMHEKKENKENVIYPVCFVDNTSDPIDVRPNDNWKAFSFWEIFDPAHLSYPLQGNSVRKYAITEYDAAAIFWINLKRIDSSSYNEIRSEMREEIKDVFENKLLGQNVLFQTDEIYERDINKIYSGYDLQDNYNILKWPYIAFRFNGVIRYKSICPVSFSHSL